METRYADLVKEWQAGKFRPVYYFIGEDASARSEAAAALKAAIAPDGFNFAHFAGDPAGQAAAVVSEAMTLPVFADRRLVVVESAKLPAEVRSVLAGYLQAPSPSTSLVLFSEERKLDARDALLKAAAAAGAVCLFKPLREEDAVARLQAEARRTGKGFSAEAAEALVAEAGTDWAILKQELEKAALFAAQAQSIGPEHVAACLGYQKTADPFALPRLIQTRQLKAALTHLQRFFHEGKPSDQAFHALNQIRSAVLKQLRAKRMLKAGRSEAEVFGSLRLHSYYDRDYLGMLKRLSEARLRRDLGACLEAEVSLKSRTWLSAAQEIERLVVDLCSK
ncbi:MAG: DNA polymerase III subunit delta [Elusimicrobia bacterium]|nr:DNA polymerase III subunit delta [Elusimicrobiota bacterium]